MDGPDVPAETQRLSFANRDELTLRNVLVATDFSDCSGRAHDYALGIASRYAAKLHVLHCVDPAPYNLGMPEAIQTACEAAWRDMRGLESNIRSNGRARNIQVEGRVEAADVTAALPEVVKQLDIGLIVAGAHGRTGLRKLLLGSVAESIMDQASCPVLTVGPASRRTRIQQSGPESILLASDSPAHSRLAESYAFSLALKYDSRLTAVSVIEDRSGRVLAQMARYEWRGIESSNGKFSTAPARSPQLPAYVGTASDLILEVADCTAADLMVLTVPAVHRFSDRFVSSNPYRLVCGAACPVLTVRAE